jgi:hypothetical protein
MQPTRRVSALFGVLLLHAFGALTWVASLGFGADIGTDRVAIVYGW